MHTNPCLHTNPSLAPLFLPPISPPANCDFYPRTHLLPAGYKDWKEDFQNGKGIWIYKVLLPCN